MLERRKEPRSIVRSSLIFLCTPLLVVRLSREWREANESPHEMATPEELDIDIKSLRDFNKMLMIKLSEVAGRHPEIESRFHQLCQEVFNYIIIHC